MNRRICLVVLTITALLFLPAQAPGSTHCGYSMAAQASKENLSRLLQFVESDGQALAGAYRVKKPGGGDPHYLILVRRPVPGTTLDGAWGVGNDQRRLLSSSLLIVDQNTVFWNRLRRGGGWALGIAGLGLLSHELLNPGVLPNSLPVIPVLAVVWAGPTIAANLFALAHRLSGRIPDSIEDFESELASYVLQGSPQRRGLRAWLSRQLGYRPPPVIQVIDISYLERRFGSERSARLDLASRIQRLSPRTYVEQMDSLNALRVRLAWDLGVIL